LVESAGLKIQPQLHRRCPPLSNFPDPRSAASRVCSVVVFFLNRYVRCVTQTIPCIVLYSVCERHGFRHTSSPAHAQGFHEGLDGSHRPRMRKAGELIIIECFSICTRTRRQLPPCPVLFAVCSPSLNSRESFPTQSQSRYPRQCVMCNGDQMSCTQPRKRKYKHKEAIKAVK